MRSERRDAARSGAVSRLFYCAKPRLWWWGCGGPRQKGVPYHEKDFPQSIPENGRCPGGGHGGNPYAARLGAACTGEAEPCKGDVVLLLSNDIHSNLGPSKQMGQDGVTHVTGGVARMAAAQAQIRRRAAGKYLTLDGGDFSQGTPYQDGYQKGWEILALAQMEVDFCTLGNHEFDVGDQAVANAWSAARDNALRYGVDHSLPQLLVSNLFIKYDAEGHEIRYTAADIRPEDLSTNPFGSGTYGHVGAKNYVVKRVGEHLVGLFGLSETKPTATAKIRI